MYDSVVSSTNACGDWSSAGRAGRPRWVAASYFALGPDAHAAAGAYISRNYAFDPELAARRLATLPKGRTEVLATIARHASMGVDELILRPVTADLAMLEELGAIVATSPG